MTEPPEAAPEEPTALAGHPPGPTHLDRFQVINYRGLDGLELSHLAPVNLITGRNSAGKTSLLEALGLFHGRYHANVLWNAHLLRLPSAVADPVATLSDVGQVALTGAENGSGRTFSAHMERAAPQPEGHGGRASGGSEQLHMPVVGILHRVLDGEEATGGWQSQATPEGHVFQRAIAPPHARPNTVFLNATREMSLMDEELGWFSDLVRQGHRTEIARVTTLVAPEVRDLQLLIGPSSNPYLSAMLDRGRDRPVQVMGAGFVRLCRLLFGCFAARGGILLVDEIENGLHHSVLPKLWRHLRILCEEWSVQLFVTTHSAECLDAAMETFGDTLGDLAVHSLYRRATNGTIGAATYTGDALTGAQSLDLEMR